MTSFWEVESDLIALGMHRSIQEEREDGKQKDQTPPQSFAHAVIICEI